MEVLSSNLIPYCHISLRYIVGVVINANHHRSQPTPSHCAMCRYVGLLLLLLLLPLLELLVHGYVTLLGKVKWEVDCEDGSCVIIT